MSKLTLNLRHAHRIYFHMKSRQFSGVDGHAELLIAVTPCLANSFTKLTIKLARTSPNFDPPQPPLKLYFKSMKKKKDLDP
jgi:hypothetical protein